MEEVRLMKGNEAIAEAAIRAGADAYFGYPITPQSEVMEYLTQEKPHERTGMVVLQAESEIAAINMIYGAASTGKKVIISSSSPGISLMQEGISYLAGGELPCLIVNVVRGGPGLGTIQPSQADYFQATRGGGHGDYRTLVLAPASVQEMADFVTKGFELAFKYHNPTMILSDGIIGQMMEKVKFDKQVPRWTDEEVINMSPWAATGKNSDRERNIIDSVELDPVVYEKFNQKLVEKYKKMEEEDVMFEKTACDDAEYLIIAFGSASRICMKALDMARKQGVKVGLLRPITLFPFPNKAIQLMTKQLKGILTVEMTAGQMVEDVQLAINDNTPVCYYGRMGGIIPTASEIVEALKNSFKL